jgi:hypothetical protein
MAKVPEDRCAGAMALFCDGFQVEGVAALVLDVGKGDQSNGFIEMVLKLFVDGVMTQGMGGVCVEV